MDGKSRFKERVRKVLLVYPTKGVTSYWLDGIYPLQYLEKQRKVVFVEKVPRQVTREDIQEADLIYCIRCKDLRILLLAKELRKPFIYFTDDNFFIVLKEYTDRQKKEVEAALAFISRVDAAVVVSQSLLETVRQYNKNTVFITPYQLFLEDLPRNQTGGEIVIGHMSTLYREKHLEFVIPAIIRILNEFDGKARFEFFGHKPNELMGNNKVSHFDFIVDYMEFRRFLAARHWDIGIAPLRDGPFIRSKTDNKFREFSAHKICGIYSNVQCYSGWVKHMETGYLVENNENEWYQAMKQLIVDKELRTKITAAASNYVRENYRMERYCGQLLDVFNGFE